MDRQWAMQTNRKSFGTIKNDRYVQVAVMDEWPLWQVLLYIQTNSHATTVNLVM